MNIANPSEKQPDFNLQHLSAELKRIDTLVQQAITHYREAGQDISDPLLGLQNSPAYIATLQQRPPFLSNEKRNNQFLTAYEQANREAQTILETAYLQGQPTRLTQFATTFNLSQFEYDALLICLLPMVDLRYERFFGFLQDDVTRKHPTVNLILNLVGPSDIKRLTYLHHFEDNAPLFVHRLLHKMTEINHPTPALLSRPLQVDDTVVAWLLGHYRPSPQLEQRLKLTQPDDAPLDQCITAPLQTSLRGIVQQKTQPIVVFYGVDTLCQAAAARQIAAWQQKPLLQVDLAAIIEVEGEPLSALRVAFRDARLTQAILYLQGWDACLVDGSPPVSLLTELCEYPDWVIVAGERPWQARHLARERTLHGLEFARPAYPQRQQLWRTFADQLHLTATMPDTLIADIAGQFVLTTGQIRDAVASTCDLTQQRQSQAPSTDTLAALRSDLFAAARAHSNPRLSDLARKISPRYEWSDLVLPSDLIVMLRELVATVKGRPKVIEAWGIGKKLAANAGVTVMFAGRPGTGKTMAAEVIAKELGLDLYKINLSTIVSKYIGETEKNLEKVFTEAQNSNAILFFDEADSIFGKRSEVKDARDRYANLEVSYLLQRMEAYDGVTILATNLRSNLDEAFTRRMQFIFDVPFPNEAARLEIWQTLFPWDVPHEDGLDFQFMAKKFKLAGGNIRNIIVSAAYLAAAADERISMEHLYHATRRELQKMGRLISEADIRPDADGTATNVAGRPRQPSSTQIPKLQLPSKK